MPNQKPILFTTRTSPKDGPCLVVVDTAVCADIEELNRRLNDDPIQNGRTAMVGEDLFHVFDVITFNRRDAQKTGYYTIWRERGGWVYNVFTLAGSNMPKDDEIRDDFISEISSESAPRQLA